MYSLGIRNHHMENPLTPPSVYWYVFVLIPIIGVSIFSFIIGKRLAPLLKSSHDPSDDQSLEHYEICLRPVSSNPIYGRRNTSHRNICWFYDYFAPFNNHSFDWCERRVYASLHGWCYGPCIRYFERYDRHCRIYR